MKNRTTVKQAIALKRWDYFKALTVNGEKLSPAYFYECDADWLLQMMLDNIPLAEPGYDDENLKARRKDVFDAILRLTPNLKFQVIEIVRDQLSTLHRFLLEYEMNAFESVTNFLLDSKSSPEEFKEILDAVHTALKPKLTPKATTANTFVRFGLDSLDEKEVELEIQFPDQDDLDTDKDASSFESIDLASDEDTQEFTPKQKR